MMPNPRYDSDIVLIDLTLLSSTFFCVVFVYLNNLWFSLNLLRSPLVPILASCCFLRIPSSLVVLGVASCQVLLALFRPNIWVLLLTDSKSG